MSGYQLYSADSYSVKNRDKFSIGVLRREPEAFMYRAAGSLGNIVASHSCTT